MDLLKGYGSEDSSGSSSSSAASEVKPEPPAAAAAAAAATAAPRKQTAVAGAPQKTIPVKAQKGKRGGKRILSLGAVLPPEIFDRLTRPPEDDDSSTSSFDGAAGDEKNNGKSKKRKRLPEDEKDNKSMGLGGELNNGSGDRTELNSLLSELRSTPLQVSAKKSGTSTKKDCTTNESSNKNSGKLGMAFMSYTSTTTAKKKANEVVDIHAAPRKAVQQMTSEQEGGDAPPTPAPPSAPGRPSFTRISAAAPVAPSFQRTVPQYPNVSSLPEYPVASQTDTHHVGAPMAAASNTTNAQTYNSNNYDSGAAPKSRKQRRDEERALRSGRAFQDNSAAAATTMTALHQPSPTEFAPTAHAAAVASKAARHRGVAAGGGGSVKNIAMYDPSTGNDVKGMGVTGKHRSKHQINQLMASAISLEAHRASEAELARFGAGGGTGKGSSSRADAKRKYGW